ncbi:MAG TPA: hypothetical protein VJR47_08055 [Stellaceae bacterium]|nr:hypothetical protein [Stellaceae bacterium]
MVRFLLFGIVLLTFMKLIEDALGGIAERCRDRSSSEFSWRLFFWWCVTTAMAVWGIFSLLAALAYGMGFRFGIVGFLAAPLVAILVLTALAGLRRQSRSDRRFAAFRLALAAVAAWAAAYLVTAQQGGVATWAATERLLAYTLILAGVAMWIGYLHARSEDPAAVGRGSRKAGSVSFRHLPSA